jgi:hypothetical protein
LATREDAWLYRGQMTLVASYEGKVVTRARLLPGEKGAEGCDDFASFYVFAAPCYDSLNLVSSQRE